MTTQIDHKPGAPSLELGAPSPSPSGAGLTWLVREKLGERRFYRLVEAIRSHEAEAAGEALDPHDAELYAALRATCHEL